VTLSRHIQSYEFDGQKKRRSTHESQIAFSLDSVLCVGAAHRLPKQRFGHHLRGDLEFNGHLYRGHDFQRE
jgi:hypothetical protein